MSWHLDTHTVHNVTLGVLASVLGSQGHLDDGSIDILWWLTAIYGVINVIRGGWYLWDKWKGRSPKGRSDESSN